MFKVFLAATVGTVLGAYLEPRITPHLPAQLATNPTVAKAVHASIAGGAAVGIYWGLGKAGVKAA